MDCSCHKEHSKNNHELCCGFPDGRNPDCPARGDRRTSCVYITPGGGGHFMIQQNC